MGKASRKRVPARMASRESHGPGSFTVRLAESVALSVVLGALDIESMAVTETRFFVLYDGEVLQLEVDATRGDAGTVVEGRILESTQSRPEHWPSLVDRFTSRFTAAATRRGKPAESAISETDSR